MRPVKNVLVCITRKKTADKLIEYAEKFICDENDKMYIVNIGSYEMYYLNKTEENEDLDYLYEKALEQGADIKTIRSNNVVESLFNYVKLKEISQIVIEEKKELRGLKNLEVKLKKEGIDIACDYVEI